MDPEMKKGAHHTASLKSFSQAGFTYWEYQ